MGGDLTINDIAGDSKIREVFLTVWDKAKDSEDYNKKDWQELRRLLNLRGIRV